MGGLLASQCRACSALRASCVADQSSHPCKSWQTNLILGRNSIGPEACLLCVAFLLGSAWASLYFGDGPDVYKEERLPPRESRDLEHHHSTQISFNPQLQLPASTDQLLLCISSLHFSKTSQPLILHYPHLLPPTHFQLLQWLLTWTP